MKVSPLFFVVTVSAQYLFRSPPIINKRSLSVPWENLLLKRQSACSSNEVTCSFGGCCPSGTTCEMINNSAGCCPVGSNCGQASSSAAASASATQAQTQACATGSYLCPDNSACCATGTLCVRDDQGNTGCCPVGQTCSGTTLGFSQGASTTNTAAGTTSASPTTSSAQTSLSPSQSAGAQGNCQSGFIACTDGSGGCCPSGTQV
jgi:hypothetical protein